MKWFCLEPYFGRKRVLLDQITPKWNKCIAVLKNRARVILFYFDWGNNCLSRFRNMGNFIIFSYLSYQKEIELLTLKCFILFILHAHWYLNRVKRSTDKFCAQSLRTLRESCRITYGQCTCRIRDTTFITFRLVVCLF